MGSKQGMSLLWSVLTARSLRQIKQPHALRLPAAACSPERCSYSFVSTSPRGLSDTLQHHQQPGRHLCTSASAPATALTTSAAAPTVPSSALSAATPVLSTSCCDRRSCTPATSSSSKLVGRSSLPQHLPLPAFQCRPFSTVNPSPSALSDIVKLQDLSQHSAEEIGHIWTKYYEEASSIDCVGAVLTAQEYELMQERAKHSPNFVVPLGKPGGGFVTLVMQCQMPHVLFTTLEEYKKFTTGAPPHLTLMHYQELADSKGVVLVRGDIINNKVVSVPEAQALMQLVRAFYCDDVDYEDVHNFNHEPSKFDFDALLAKLRLRGT